MAKSDLYDKLYRAAQRELFGMLQDEEREIVKVYASALLSIRRRLRKIYDNYEKNGELRNAEKTLQTQLSGLNDQIADILSRCDKTVIRRALDGASDQFEESFFRHAYAIDQSGGMSLSWSLIPEDAVKASIRNGYKQHVADSAVSVFGSKVIEKVQHEVSLATIRGDSYDDLARRIGNLIGVGFTGNEKKYTFLNRGAAYHARLIARTEGQRALVEGQAEASKQALEMGCDIETIWDATLDGRTRPAHGMLDGKPKDDPEKGWNVPGIGWVSAPLHSGIASFDINCRCRMRDQVRGYPPEERYVRGDGVSAYQTYDDWLARVAGDADSEGVEIPKYMDARITDYQIYKLKHSGNTAVIDREGKIGKYCLGKGLSEEQLSDKAGKWYGFRKVLGYTDDDTDLLIHNIREGLQTATVKPKGNDTHGRRYQAQMILAGPNGKKCWVNTSWMYRSIYAGKIYKSNDPVFLGGNVVTRRKV